MQYRANRVCIRFSELEFARMQQCLGHNYAFEASKFIRDAVAMYCQRVESERKRHADEDAQLELNKAAKPQRAKRQPLGRIRPDVGK